MTGASVPRVVLTQEGATEVHLIDGAPVLHEGAPVLRVVRDGRQGLAPLGEVAEVVALEGGGQVLCARQGVAAADPGEDLRPQVEALKGAVTRAVKLARAWRASAQRWQRVAGGTLADEAEALLVARAVRVEAGAELVPIAAEEAPANPILEALRGAGLGATVGAVWLCGGVLGLTPWWEEAWWACKAVTVALCVGWVLYRAGKGWRAGRAWVPVVEGGRYSVRVDRHGSAAVLCRRGECSGWRPIGEFCARPAAPQAPDPGPGG